MFLDPWLGYVSISLADPWLRYVSIPLGDPWLLYVSRPLATVCSYSVMYCPARKQAANPNLLRRLIHFLQ